MLNRLSGMPFGIRIAATMAAMTQVVLAVRVMPRVRETSASFFVGRGLPRTEAEFLAQFTFVPWLAGLGIIFVLWIVVRIEKRADWKVFFMIDRTEGSPPTHRNPAFTTSSASHIRERGPK